MKVIVSTVARLLTEFRAVRNTLAVLWLLPQMPASSQDIGFVAVTKGHEFHQTSAGIVSLGEWRTWNETGEVQQEGQHIDPIHMFETFVVGTAMGSIISGSVAVPGGEVVNLVQDFLGDVNMPEIGAENGYDSPLELNTARPDGVYTVQLITKNQGTMNIPLSLSGAVYPSVPHVTNFNSLQSANASSSVTVQWLAMAGGTPTDFVQLKVMQLGGVDDGMIIWESGMPGEPGALNGTSSQAVIPSGVLQAGTDYHAELLFVKTVEVKTSPAFAIAGYTKLTGFRIRTAAPLGMPLGADLLRSNPPDGWSFVAVDSAVAFHFSHPMMPGQYSVSWMKDGVPLNTGTFSYQWTQSNTVLLCKFSSDLPADSEIGWTLDLAGFRDANGMALSGTASGSFRTGTEPAMTPPDAGFISMIKTRYFLQDGNSPMADGRYEALAQVEANAANRLKSASVSGGGRSGPLYVDPWDGTEYEGPGEYASKSDLDRFYPNGSYLFSLDGIQDGSQSVTLDLGATDQYPDAPTVTNFNALQAVDPNAPAVITWNALSDWNNDRATFAAGDGLIQLEILDNFGREVFWVEGFDDLPNGTQVEIPAGTFWPGRNYQARLYFLRVIDIDGESYPDVFAVAAFESQTSFTIKTTGEPLMPKLAVARNGVSANITASGGELNMSYALEVSHNLQRWTPLVRYWNNGTAYQYDDTDAQYLKARFYRLRESHPLEQVAPNIAIQGTVWTNISHTTPVAGATVGTSLDGRTTTTDSQGRFFLMTDTPSMGGFSNYIISVTSGTQTKSFGPFNWGDQPRSQVFEMQ